MNYFENINEDKSTSWIKEIFKKENIFIDLIRKLDCADEEKVKQFVYILVSLIKKNTYDEEISDTFFLLSKLRTNKYFSICIDGMLYCEECPEPLVDYELFKRFLVDPENYE